jgi:outer membrane protein assembly factor BamE (lipoprotein component of BamABCDE complex)
MFSSFVCLILLSGCTSTSTSTGPKLDQNAVNSIQKGVTTRQEVIDRLGQPIATQMMGDGRRMLVYASHQTNYQFDGKRLIPFVGGLIPATDRQTARTQNLQVIVDASDVVRDYEFSDQTSDTAMRSSAFGGSANTQTQTNK